MDNVTDYKQSLVLEQRYKLQQNLIEANRVLDDKANAILQIGGVVVGLVAAFSLPNLAVLVRGDGTVGIPWLSQTAIVLAFALFLVALWLYREAQSPQAYELSGGSDWDKTFNKYLYVEPIACFDQVLTDLLNSIESLENLNDRKARHVNSLGWLLLCRFFFVSLAVAFG